MRLDMAPLTRNDYDMQSMSVGRQRPSVAGRGKLSGRVLPLAGLILFALAATVSFAQNSARRTVWDGSYTEAQATRGAGAFGTSCGGCHVLSAEGRAPLVGDPFWKSFSQKTVGDLLEFVTAYMPNGNPRSLTETTYNDIVALILKSNGFPAGVTELGRDTTAGVEIIPKDGRAELPANALARVVGCLARSGADWAVTNATAPERAERVVPAGEDATRPLGSRTMPLKFVLTRLDALAGSRVVVTGILMGEGGVDGINVTEVNRVAPKCP
jgi:mono/diheme cytochrome c family protein